MYNKEGDFQFLGYCVMKANKPYYLYFKVIKIIEVNTKIT
jgi:hypothetical protein